MNKASHETKLGIKFAQSGNLEQAAIHFKNAFNCDQRNPGLLKNLLRCLQLQAKHQSVIDIYMEYVETTAERTNNDILFMVSDSAQQLKEYGLRLLLIKKLYSQNKNNAEITIMLSEALLCHTDFEEAVKLLRDAIREHPDNLSLMTNLAIAQAELGEYKIAEELYKKVVYLSPNQFLGHYNLGLFLKTLGRYNEAKESFRLCLKLVPNAPEALNALQSLGVDQLKKETDLEKFFSLVEEKKWGSSAQLLKDIKDEIKVFKFLAASCELPTQQQRALNVEAATNPHIIVEKMNIFEPNCQLNQRLIEIIYKEPSLIMNRAGKPTRMGMQTHEVIAHANKPEMIKLIERIEELVNVYKNSKGQYLETYMNQIENNLSRYSISGWAVVLKKGGYQKRHIHPESILSGIIYIKTPKLTESTNVKEGNLVFSTHNPREISPKQGDLVIFPSYMPHETVPITTSEERVCIAFNIIAA